MTRRTGSANLPLHGGQVPAWLSMRMAALGRVIVEAIVHHYGRDELLHRLADPFWFQAFGAVMGMDWHSSGITTSVIGALKRGLAPVRTELGLFVCGIAGLAVTGLIIWITEYYTGTDFRPVKSIAAASVTGHGTNVIQGLAISLESTALPALVIIAGILVMSVYVSGLNALLWRRLYAIAESKYALA